MSATSYGPEDHLTALAEQGRLLALAVRDGDGDAPVGGCPGWTLDDVARHTGSVHEWATEVLRAGRPPEWGYDDLMPRAPRQHDELPEWYLVRLDDLVTQLRETRVETEVWTLFGDLPGRDFWRRRQAFETLVHRMDAESAAGRRSPVEPGLAADGVHEALQMVRFRTRWPGVRPVEFVVEATDASVAWTLGIEEDRERRTLVEGVSGEELGHPGQGERVRLAGRAVDLLSTLWNRPPQQPVRFSGDVAAWDLWREHARIR